ncbi:hypothetical protein BV372_22490 [Nostoc sp. T09]|nr:hypothetical protein BV372_22490 [Nostoc sp. T09]
MDTTVSYDTSAKLSGGATNVTIAMRASGGTIIGSNANDVIISYATNTILKGGAGIDALKGSSGSTVWGGIGNDALEITNSNTGTLIGGAGDDSYNVAQVGSLIIDENSDGGSGIDTVVTTIDFSLTSQTGVTLKGFIENLTLTAGAVQGIGNNLNNIIKGNNQNNILNGLDANDTIYGAGGNDTIDGGNNNDRLFGGEGNDSLTAGSGTDLLTGDNGDDTYNIDSSDTVVEVPGQGFDTVNVFGSWTTTAEVEVVNLTFSGANSITLNNTLGTTVRGNTVRDDIVAGIGSDTMNGRAGSDVLTGRGGADVFEFGGAGLALTSLGTDTITDFSSAQTDVIRLSASTFTALASFVGSNLTGSKGFIAGHYQSNNSGNGGVFAQNAYIVYNLDNGLLFYNPDLTTGGYINGGNFATLTGAPASLGGANFAVVA